MSRRAPPRCIAETSWSTDRKEMVAKRDVSVLQRVSDICVGKGAEICLP